MWAKAFLIFKKKKKKSKITQNIKKKKKNFILASFLAKPGWDNPKKRKNNFRSGYHFCPTRAKAFPKKNSKKSKIIQKIEKRHSSFISS